MAGTASRRGFGFLVAVAVAILPALIQPLPTAAATNGGTLFGINVTTVYKIDTVTGALTTFAPLPPPPPTQMNPSFNGLASDPIGHRLFTVRSSISTDFTTQFYNLVTIDTQSAAVSVGPDMPQGAPELAYDTSSKKLFGITNFCCPFQLVSIDPGTGVQTHIAYLPGVQESNLAVAPSKHAIYMLSESFLPGQFQRVVNVIAVDESTGAITTTNPALTTGAFQVAYDTSTGTLYGKSFCCPLNLLKIDPSTGAETTVETTDLGLGAGFAMDSASHNIYMTQDVNDVFGFFQVLQTVNDQSGAISLGSAQLPTGSLQYLAFEGVAITPGSIKADVNSAVVSGAIDNAGVATALLSQLDAASAARTNGQCGTAANIYNAFIDAVNAQSGKHIAAATAAQLVSEAQFLIANCP